MVINMDHQLMIAFALCTLAGLSTGFGSLIAFFTDRTNTKMLSLGLGFSAGVMIYVSMMDLLPQARHQLVLGGEGVLADWMVLGGFLGGMLLIASIDKFVPEPVNPHELQLVGDLAGPAEEKGQEGLKRVGLFTALAIANHNFPEGMATFVSALQDPSIGVAIALAVAIHNIPEGMAVALLVFYATGSRKKAFLHSFLSGMAEPVGAVAGYLLLLPYLNYITFGIVFAVIAGIMVYISLDELLPAARKFGEHHLSIYGVIGGMMIMAVSLILL
ncbi:zinc/iron permease [Desulforamulus ruminis DSM 2154]|uniref:Zinc transporter ZupT n=2 Tax=Desulforamulus ruminis TaxID=1564 RepID=F6DKR1_DESRL|nr:zinc transporter ZupT [Desulforamulus ruminis]AEG60436.1 zinc/iron permease [Desulforamulus ruminis DSM 2154]